MKPVGWRSESYRHYLAAKGVKSRGYYAAQPVYKTGIKFIDEIREASAARDEALAQRAKTERMARTQLRRQAAEKEGMTAAQLSEMKLRIEEYKSAGQRDKVAYDAELANLRKRLQSGELTYAQAKAFQTRYHQKFDPQLAELRKENKALSENVNALDKELNEIVARVQQRDKYGAPVQPTKKDRATYDQLMKNYARAKARYDLSNQEISEKEAFLSGVDRMVGGMTPSGLHEYTPEKPKFVEFKKPELKSGFRDKYSGIY